MDIFRLITITLSLTLLVSCGGGGGGGSSSVSPGITPAQISSALHEIAGQEDEVLTLNNEPDLGTREHFLPRNNARIESDGTNNGMNLFIFGGTYSTDTGVLRYANWGGWDGDIVFGYQVLYEEDDTVSAENYYVYGEPSTSRPQGLERAVWRGASTGHHAVETGNDGMGVRTGTETAWRGNVVLDIDNLNTPDVDITVSGLESLDPEGTYPALVNATASAEDIPLLNNGTFTSTGSGNEEWHGGFYGEDHSYVGGVFRQGDLVGAFGAKRQ